MVTRGEYRGALALGGVLAIVLAIVALCNRQGGSGSSYALPDVVKLQADSAKQIVPDSVDVVEVKSKETRPTKMRPSPLDEVNY